MQARLQEFAEGLLPNALQYPIKRLKKSYDNFSQSRKLTTTSIRLASEVYGAVLAATSVLMSSDWYDALYGFSEANLGNPAVAEIAMYGVLAFAGYGVASVVSKQTLRAYHYYQYGVTNEEYIALRPDEVADLESTWNVKPELSNDVFEYLKKEIMENKKAAKKAECTDDGHLHTAASTKLVLQKFRSAGQSDDGSLMVITDYFYGEVEASKNRIENINKQLEVYHLSIAPRPLALVVESVGDEKKAAAAEEKEVVLKEKEDMQIKRNLMFLRRNAKKKAPHVDDVMHDVTNVLQAEIKVHEQRIETIRGFASRLTRAGA